MNASSSRPPASSADGLLVAGVVAALVVGLDQLTKAWAVSALDDGRTIDLVWTLRLKLTFNDGAAFSLGGGSGGLLAVVGLVVVVVVYRSVLQWPGRLPPVALGLVLGGAIGNLVDRVARDGAVVDFIDLQWWPLFNVADIAVSCGAVSLIVLSLRQDSDAAEPALITEVVPAALAGERLDRLVSLVTGCSRSAAAALVAGGAVRVGGEAVTSGKHRLVEGDEVAIDAPADGGDRIVGDPSVVVPVVHEDDHVVVLDKPAGLVVHPGAGHVTGTLVHGLVARYPELVGVGEADRPGIVHRLDRDTSGLLVVARTEQARQRLVRALAARQVTREYLALVAGLPEADSGLVDAPVGRSAREPTRMAVSARGKEARTRYAVERRWERSQVSLLRCRLETGRTHQIRVHLAAIGHPVVGDATYATGRRPDVEVPRLFLHATRLGFAHPVDGTPLAFESPLPDDLAPVLGRLEGEWR